MLCIRNFDQRVLISDAVGVKQCMLLVRSCRYGLYAAAGVVWLVISTSLLLLLVHEKMKGSRSISADYTISELNIRSALSEKAFLSASGTVLRSHVIMISLSMRGRDLGIIGGGVGFFFLRDTMVNGLSLRSAAAVMHAAQVSSSVVGLYRRGAAAVPACWVGGPAGDLPLSGLLPVGLLGARVVFCCWCIQWSLAVMEATCFSSSWIRFVLVACEESMAFSMCSTCRDSCRIS
jgi:hypothetical protein